MCLSRLNNAWPFDLVRGARGIHVGFKDVFRLVKHIGIRNVVRRQWIAIFDRFDDTRARAIVRVRRPRPTIVFPGLRSMRAADFVLYLSPCAAR